MPSADEPVSAYSVFKANKTMVSAAKNSKKKQNAAKKSTKPKSKKKLLYKPTGAGATKLVKNNNSNVSNASKSTKKGRNKQNNKYCNEKPSGIGYERSELMHSLDNVCTGEKNKQNKAYKKKNELLEANLAAKLYGNHNKLGEEENDSYTDLDASSDGYTINQGNSYLKEDYSNSDQTSSSINEDDKSTNALPQSKADKKRKRPKTTQTLAEDSFSNNLIETKKSKKGEETTKGAIRKSGKRKQYENNQHHRTSLSNNEITNGYIKLEPLQAPTNVVKMNSIEEGKRVFKWLLNPLPENEFFSNYWEQKSCLIRRQQESYFKHLISFKAIDEMLIKNHVEFTKNIDVTSYENGIRKTLNPEGRALPPSVWEHYGQGCSIRLLNPQTFISDLFTISTTMQEYFHCLVGANAYLTPPNSQGFAPHYDDIEAFVLQIEGRKRWKLYKPRSAAEMLPRNSSKNFTQQEIGEPVFEEVLEPGDVLYFPRGTIHQACTEPGYHSLHITLSVYQKQSFADLFEKMLPLMLEKAISSNLDLRKGLPLNAWHNAGLAFSNNSNEERADLTKKVTHLMQKFCRQLNLEDIMDSAMDQLAKKFQHEALPPEILPGEKMHTVFGSRNNVNERGECVFDYDINERTNVRLLRANILRLVKEEGNIRIYYYLDNSKEYCEYEPNFIEIEPSEAASIEVLIKSYPQYVGVSQLPLPSDEQKIVLATALWERGLLMMEKPIK